MFHRVYHPYALRQLAKPVTRLRGRTLLTDPEVFHPVCFLSTPVFIDYLSTVAVAGKRLLDMGTGSGTIGIFAASRGARVTACDINPRAVALAGENARRNDVEMEVLASDLFSALDGRSFDLICFNLPFYVGEPRSGLRARAVRRHELRDDPRVRGGVPAALAPGGTVAVIFSEDSGPDRMMSLFVEAGFVATDQRTAHRYFERFHLLRLQVPSAPPAEQHR